MLVSRRSAAICVSARSAGNGEIDVLLWAAGQVGDWYDQDHRAFAVSAEAGYRERDPLAPWLRGGISWFSGDTDAQDHRHGTFFPMLPTVRRYSQSTLYSMANLRDITLLQAILFDPLKQCQHSLASGRALICQSYAQSCTME